MIVSLFIESETLQEMQSKSLIIFDAMPTALILIQKGVLLGEKVFMKWVDLDGKRKYLKNIFRELTLHIINFKL